MHRIVDAAAWLVMTAAILFAQAAGAIVAGDPAGMPADSPQARIVPNAAGSSWSGVGRLEAGGKSYTATVIGPRHILTAAHAVSRHARAENATFLLYLDSAAPHRVSASRIFIHPDYRGFKPAADGLVHDDIAIVELSEMVPFGVPVYPLHLQPLASGTPLLLVGFGVSGDGVKGVAEGSGIGHVKRAGGNAADNLVADEGGSGAQEIFVFDFDGPDTSTNFLGGGSLGNGIEATLGVGDSGSPAFVRVNGQWHLAGVNTFVTYFGGGPTRAGVFGTGGGGMLLSAYANWIMQSVSTLSGMGPARPRASAEMPEQRSARFQESATQPTQTRHLNAIKSPDNARSHLIPTNSYKKS